MSVKVPALDFAEWLKNNHTTISIAPHSHYINTHTPIGFVCSCGHIWDAPPQRIKQGHGCPNCSKKVTAGKNTISQDVFLQKLNERNIKYSTKIVTLKGNQQYAGTNTKLEWECQDGHIWESIPKTILRGSYCPECKRLNNIKRHSNSFLNDHKEYLYHQHLLEKKSLTQIASELGTTPETISKYLKYHSLPLKKYQQSWGEKEVISFIETFNIPFETSVNNIISPHELDIYIPSYNLAIEYCGLYWHSDIHTRIDKNYHRQKYIDCKNKGIRLVTIFSDEWHNQQQKVKASLRHFLHQSPKGTPGRKVNVRLIDWATAKPFLDKHHLQSAGPPGKYSIGAFSKENNTLIAVMTIGKRCSENAGRELELKRFVTNKQNNPGISTKMFSWCSKNLEIDSIIAFVDLRWFDGKCKQEMGFEVIKEISPSFYWVKKEKRYHRTLFTKSKLLEMCPHMEGMSKSKMMHSLGYTRIWDCGKLKTRKVLTFDSP